MKPGTIICLALLLALPGIHSVAAADAPKANAPTSIRRIISREDPAFHCAQARLTIGRDGMVYLANPAAGDISYNLL